MVTLNDAIMSALGGQPISDGLAKYYLATGGSGSNLHDIERSWLVSKIGSDSGGTISDPVAIGAWEQDGTPVAGYALNEAAWLDVAPDDFDMADPENPIAVRPTAWRDIHRWAGWGDKQA